MTELLPLQRSARHWLPVPWRAALALGLALGLGPITGCAGPGLAARHRALEAEWQTRAPRGAAATADDPLAGAPALSREQLVRSVLERNPTVRAARYAWRAALARYPQVTSLDDPMLGAGVVPPSFGSDTVNEAYQVDLSQKLPFPGKLGLRGEIALAEAEAAAKDHEAVRLRLATMASLLFDELYFLDRSLEINDEHLELLADFLRIATVRYEAGEAAQQAPLQAEVEQAHLIHRAVVLATSRRVVTEQINQLLHRPAGRPLPPLPRSLALPSAAVPDAEALLARALENRPEVQAARARVAGHDSAVSLARREFLPDFTLVGAYNGVMQESDLQPFVGLQVNVPLRLARRRAALDEARAELERSEAEQAGVEDEVGFAVVAAVERMREAHQVLQLFRDRLLPAAGDQVEAARAGFESGTNSFLALIDAERSLRTVRLGHEEAVANLSRRRAELDRAIGQIPGVAW